VQSHDKGNNKKTRKIRREAKKGKSRTEGKKKIHTREFTGERKGKKKG